MSNDGGKAAIYKLLCPVNVLQWAQSVTPQASSVVESEGKITEI